MISTDGSIDISWEIKQETKNEFMGKDKLAIEAFPKDSNLADVINTYHLFFIRVLKYQLEYIQLKILGVKY